MKYMLIAGEASGDIHAAQVIRELRHRDKGASFIFFGGDMMAEAAGIRPFVHYRDMAYMGFSEVIHNLGKINANLKSARRLLRMWEPAALILVDYPSFNLKVAAEAKKLGIPVFYYISPKVWAWKEWRVPTLKKLVTRMYSILPFEVDWYRKNHQWNVKYVGNPSVEEMEHALRHAPSRADFLKEHKLRDRPIIALLPGSRLGEIKNNLEIMNKAVEQFPQYRGVVAGAPGVDPEFYRAYTSLPVLHGCTTDLLANARAAIVTSGTATLETALAGVPQVVCYRSNGSKITYNVMKRVLSVDHVTLPNLITDSTIIPEMLMHQCTPDAVAEQLTPLLRDTPARRAMLEGYKRMRALLTDASPSKAVADDIIATLKRIKRHLVK